MIIEYLPIKHRGKSCFTSKHAEPYYVIIMIAFVTFGAGLASSLIIVDTLIGKSLGLFGIVGLYLMPAIGYVHLQLTPCIVFEDNDGFLKYNTFGKYTYVKYKNIISIKKSLTIGFFVFVKHLDENTGKIKRFYIGPGMLKFQQVFEHFLDKSENIKELKIDKLLKRKSVDGIDVWPNEPNWNIINIAKRRAKKNASKIKK